MSAKIFTHRQIKTAKPSPLKSFQLCSGPKNSLSRFSCKEQLQVEAKKMTGLAAYLVVHRHLYPTRVTL